MRETLFRREVFEEQTARNLGRSMIKPPAAVPILVALLCAIFGSVLVFLCCGQYARREKALGILVPDRGLVRIFADHASRIDAVLVKDGAAVEANQPIARLTGERILDSGEASADMKIAELQALGDSMQARIDELPALEAQERLDLKSELERLKKNAQILQKEKAVHEHRLDLKKDRRSRIKNLADEKLISADDYQATNEAILQAQSLVHAAEQSLLAAESRQMNLESRIARLSSEYAEKKGDWLQKWVANRERLADLKLQKNQLIVAPIKGRLTNLQANPGMDIDPKKPLAVIMPDGARLEAHLFVPSRAIGFLKEGQRVLIQYEAFPPQKYGVQVGTIQDIGQSVLNPADIQEMDLSPGAEGVYRITVALPAPGFAQTLQSGMRLKADILLERRSLLEWLFAPLYRARE